MTALADAHLIAQQRLRQVVAQAVAAAWQGLPGYDAADVARFVDLSVPVVLAGQRQSAALTDAYLARFLGRQPLGINPADVTGAAVRNGTAPADVYRRPFVTVWTALGNGTQYTDAVSAGLARATGAAAMDVQLTHRATLQAVQDRDPAIRGYRRVADASACKFCVTVNGAFVKSAGAMALHNHCGCGLEPVREDVPVSPVPDTVAVHDHGELGPVLTEPGQHFTALADL